VTSDEVWRDFHLDENCVALRGEEKVRVYLSQMRRALAGLGPLLTEQAALVEAERLAVGAFLRRLSQTFEVLALRHFFRESRDLKIDTTDSGFVHFSTMIELAAEAESRDAKLSEIPPVEELKRRMLGRIVDHGVHPRELQVDMMQRLYLQSLESQKLFGAFVPGALEKLGAKDGDGGGNRYFWSFATYDRALNRPFVYLLYFQYASANGELSEDSEAFAELRDTSRSSALGRVGLLGFANRLDYKIDRISPRIVKRLVFGPYWAPHFTKTDDEIGRLLEGSDDRLPFALRFETETLLSERETQVGAGWFSKGRRRQVFWIPKNRTMTARGASRVERWLLVPDWLAPQLDPSALGDHRCVPVDAGEMK
jgi:hypothetical protein